MNTSVSAIITATGTSSFVAGAPQQRSYMLNTRNPQYMRNAVLTQDCLTLTYYTTSVVFPLTAPGGLYQAAAQLVGGLTYPPIILTQPTNSIVTHPTSSYFSISASVEYGTASYQWYSSSFSSSYIFVPLTNSINFTGCTSSLLVDVTSSVSDSGSTYYCRVGDIGGYVTSSIASSIIY
jgi:hypothetical protein